MHLFWIKLIAPSPFHGSSITGLDSTQFLRLGIAAGTRCSEQILNCVFILHLLAKTWQLFLNSHQMFISHHSCMRKKKKKDRRSTYRHLCVRCLVRMLENSWTSELHWESQADYRLFIHSVWENPLTEQFTIASMSYIIGALVSRTKHSQTAMEKLVSRTKRLLSGCCRAHAV